LKFNLDGKTDLWIEKMRKFAGQLSKSPKIDMESVGGGELYHVQPVKEDFFFFLPHS
jgi:hypothetical protein